MSKQHSKSNSSGSFLPINEQIRAREIILVDEENGTREQVNTSVALQLAKERELDLVLVAPKAVPPVAKLLDYGKYKYEQARRDRKKQGTNRKSGEIKEIRLSVRMEDHDIKQRVNQAQKFVGQGHHVLLSLRFRGRENIFRQKGIDVLKDFANRLGQEFAQPPRFAGNRVNVPLRQKNEAKDTPE